MKEKIIAKATEMFLKLGFKSVTMDDICGAMCVSKKTLYKFFANKESLIAESTEALQNHLSEKVTDIMSQNYNAIEENFEVRKMFKEIFNVADASPLYQLKKHYPEIYSKVIEYETCQCQECFRANITKGIEQGLYRKNLEIEPYIQFYYTLIFSINENTASEKEALKLELEALEYHTRAMATPKGITELEKQLEKHQIYSK